jgi:hypothetical protein
MFTVFMWRFECSFLANYQLTERGGATVSDKRLGFNNRTAKTDHRERPTYFGPIYKKVRDWFPCDGVNALYLSFFITFFPELWGRSPDDQIHGTGAGE